MDRPPKRGSVDELEEHLRDVDRALEKLYARVSALERGHDDGEAITTAASLASDSSRAMSVTTATPAVARDGSAILTLLGRTLVVLGGAFLLRAITESGRVPPVGGVLLGVAYASTWIGAAEVAGVRRPRSGLFHGLAGIVIGFPLLVEATIRFEALSAAGAAALLVALALAMLAVSWHRNLQVLATLTAAAAALTSLAGAVTTGQFAPFAVAAIIVGGAASLCALGRNYYLAAWPPAVASTLLVLGVALRAHSHPELDERIQALTIAIGLAAVYFALAMPTIASRTASTRLGDLVRAAIGLTVGIGAAFLIAADLGGSVLVVLGAALMTAGIGMYIFERRAAAHMSEETSVFLISAGATTFCIGGVMVMPAGLRYLPIGLTALEMVRASRATSRSWMYAHAAIAATTYGLSSGLVAFTIDAWIASPVSSVPPVLGVAAILLFVGLTRPSVQDAWWPPVAAFVPLGIACAAAGAAVLVMAGWIDGLPSSGAVVATERTVVLAVSAIVLAKAGSSRRNRVFRWLSYATLIATAAKLFVEDFAVSPPVGMFIAFAAYGLALIICSRSAHEE